MNKTIVSIMFVTLAAPGLAGCSHRSSRVDVRPVSSAEMLASTDVDALLEAGRGHLAANRYGLAITQFRNAVLLDPRSAAAQNGLAVAYASIGRADLARRHFEQAIAYAPGEEVYKRNYARLSETRLRTMLAAAQRESAGDSPARSERVTAQGAAVVALHTTGVARPALEAIMNRATGPSLAVTKGEEREMVRLVTNAPAPVAVRERQAPRIPVWRITTARQPLTTAAASGDRPAIERLSGQRLLLRTEAASAERPGSCGAASERPLVAVRAATLSAKIVSCPS